MLGEGTNDLQERLERKKVKREEKVGGGQRCGGGYPDAFSIIFKVYRFMQHRFFFLSITKRLRHSRTFYE